MGFGSARFSWKTELAFLESTKRSHCKIEGVAFQFLRGEGAQVLEFFFMLESSIMKRMEDALPSEKKKKKGSVLV